MIAVTCDTAAALCICVYVQSSWAAADLSSQKEGGNYISNTRSLFHIMFG